MLQLTVGNGELSLGVAISVVVGTYIVGAVLVPDLCRYARSRVDGVSAIVLSLGVGLPCILAAAAVPSLATQEADLVRIMLGLGLGVPALVRDRVRKPGRAMPTTFIPCRWVLPAFSKESTNGA